ncbi:MAG: choline/carnitine O-acyltransferase, partial [Psychromonas sp.]
SPEEISDVSKHFFHGDGKDRLFDKSLQFIVCKNGKIGANYEHTCVDGSAMLRLIGHIYDTIDEVTFGQNSTSVNNQQTLRATTEKIEFDLDEALQQTLDGCKGAFIKHMANSQTRVLDFTRFGKNKIKKFAVSPDAFVQLALQLAEYKLYGKCYSAYEAVMTRTFIHGRMDVLYTVSAESMNFIDNMGDLSCSIQTKKDSLIKATQKHIERANECRSGNGVYSHFLALKYRYKVAGTELGIHTLPQIFTDKGYQNLTNSIVCTSTTSDYGVNLAGYGPIVEDGYGIRYFTCNDSIRFNMTSRTAMKEKLDKMQTYIEQSLLEMAELMRS